jgi:hypothetical protein
MVVTITVPPTPGSRLIAFNNKGIKTPLNTPTKRLKIIAKAIIWAIKVF